MIFDYWPAEFWDRLGGSLPKDYFVFDLETSGFSGSTNFILQWGHSIVKDCKQVDNSGRYLNWKLVPGAPVDRIYADIAAIDIKMRATRGIPFHITPQLLEEQGENPFEVLDFYYGLMKDLVARRCYIAGHTIINFDLPFCAAFLSARSSNQMAMPDPDTVLDVAMIEKASICDPQKNAALRPRPCETVRDYFARIGAMRVSGKRYRLDTEMFEKYALDAKGLDRNQMHGAVQDCAAVHYVIEEMRPYADKAVAAIRKGEATPVATKQPSASLVPQRFRGQRAN